MRPLLCLLFLPLFLLSGCWDRVEVNQMAIVVGAAIDKKDEETIELSVQLAVPQALSMGQQGMGGGQGGQGMKTTLMESASGATVYDAATKIQEKVPRRIFWGHSRILVISEETAKEKIGDHIDFFLRHPQPRLRTSLFVSKGKAKDILAVLTPLENSSAKAAQELSNLRFGLQVTIMDFLQMLHSEANATALPWLEVPPPDRESGEAAPQTLWLNGSAIIKNGRMVGRIDDQTTRGLLWVLDEIGMAEITFAPSAGKGKISVQILRSRTRLIPEIKNGKWTMTIKVDTHDDIVENQSNLVLGDPRIVDVLEKDIERQIELRIRQALEWLQKELKTDAFGFADAYHRKYPAEWQRAKDRWEAIFPEIEVNILANAKVKRYGLATDPQGTPEEEVKTRQ